MAIFETIKSLIDNRRFRPFSVTLESGEEIRILMPFRALVTPREFLVSVDGRKVRHIHLSKIAAAASLSPKEEVG